MYSGSGAKIAGVVRQVGLSAASKIMCYLLVMFLECWQAKVRHEQGMVECAIRSQFGRDFANVQHEMSALSALPPPPSITIRRKFLVLVCGGRRCRQAASECNGVWLSPMPARQTLYHTLVLVCGNDQVDWVRFKMGVSFRRPLGSHTDCGRDARVPRGDSPNLDYTQVDWLSLT